MPQVVGHTTSITTVSFVTEGKKSFCVKVSELESFCLSGKQGYRKQLIVKTQYINLKLNYISSENQACQA